MRITGKGIWGDPTDPAAARDTLARVPELGITLIDTADSYGPYVSEDLIRQALHPYRRLVIATKGGITRHGPDQWSPVARPEYLRAFVLMSLRRLGLQRLHLWESPRIYAPVPEKKQFASITRIRHKRNI